jgi:hypothetical protein
VHDLPETPFGYPLELTERLARGELFNLMRNYLAVGGSVEWHALWTQSLTLIANLDDTSSLLQTQITYIPGDHQTLDVGVALPLGSAGDEFGGVPVATDAVTVGGGTQLYLRWVYYF